MQRGDCIYAPACGGNQSLLTATVGMVRGNDLIRRLLIATILFAFLFPRPGNCVSKCRNSFPERPLGEEATLRLDSWMDGRDNSVMIVCRRHTLPFILATLLAVSGAMAAESGMVSKDILQSMARSEDPAVRQRALEGWTDLNSPAALPYIVGFLGDPDDEVARAAVVSLKKISGRPYALTLPDQAGEYVLSVLTEAPPEARVRLESLLPELRPFLEKRMLAVFKSGKEEAVRRRVAAYGLGCMGSMLASASLAKGTASEDPEMAGACVEALYRLHDVGSIDTWVRLVVHPDPGIGRRALEALAELGGPKALVQLGRVAAAQDAADEGMQDQALAALKRWPPRERVPVLVDVMQQNPRLRSSALDSLREITGLDLGEKPEAWRRWLAGQSPEPLRDEKNDVVPPFVPMPMNFPNASP